VTAVYVEPGVIVNRDDAVVTMKQEST